MAVEITNDKNQLGMANGGCADHNGQCKPEPSCNSSLVNHFAMVLLYVFLLFMHDNWHWLQQRYDIEFDELFIVSLLVYTIPILLYELIVLRVYKRTTTIGEREKSSCRNLQRVAIKLYGFLVTLSLLAFAYWLFPEYDKQLYQHFFRLVYWIMPYVIPMVIIYFWWFDGYVKQPEDEYWNMGQLAIGNWHKIDKKKLANHVRSWIIKGFFLPLMINYLYSNYETIILYANAESVSLTSFNMLLTLVYIADLLPAVVGYAINAKFFDNHIRSTDDTVKGWLVCMICYAPIWPVLIYSSYLPYMEGLQWDAWLADSDLYSLWAILILVVLALYASATVTFGLRWSNLTYRGLMTTGVYRISKHPAYLFKNLSFWLITVPFVMQNGVENSVKQIFMLLIVNFIYYQRAITEERHLSKFPEYRRYAEFMNEHGYTRWMHKLVPYLKYDPRRYGY